MPRLDMVQRGTSVHHGPFSHTIPSGSAVVESRPHGLLAPALLTSVAKVAEHAHASVPAPLGIEEGAWLAVTCKMALGPNAGKIRAPKHRATWSRS